MSRTITRIEITEKTSSRDIEEFNLNPDGIEYLLYKGCKISVTQNVDTYVQVYNRLQVEIPKDIPLDRLVLYAATVFSDCLAQDFVLRDILTGVDGDYVGISGDIYDNSSY